MLPHKLAKLHPKRKTPVNALLLIGGISLLAPFFGRTALVWISDAASFACCVAYGMVALSFLVLRKKEPDMHRPYRVKHDKLVGNLASAMSAFMVLMFILPGTGSTLLAEEWIIVGTWTVLGVAFYAVSKRRYGRSFGSVQTRLET